MYTPFSQRKKVVVQVLVPVVDVDSEVGVEY